MEAADTRPNSSRRQHRRMRTDAPRDADMDLIRNGGNFQTESNKPKQKKPLDFYKAMSDFQTMFPHIDKDVIEAVLRSNDGVVQTTIDQLLVLSETTEEEATDDGTRLPNYNESLNYEDDLPPSYDEVENEILDEFARESQGTENEMPSHMQSDAVEVAWDRSNHTEGRIGRWNPPLVGPLPVDFLRIADGIGGNDMQNGPPSSSGRTETSRDGFVPDKDLEQFLEDEKLAMFLQNEEFMRQLRHDPDFLTSLEEDHRQFLQTQGSTNGTTITPTEQSSRGAVAHPGGARPRHSAATNDDAAFNRKLKHMGKTTRKKFGRLAKRFSRKRNTKFMPLAASTANLIEDESEDEIENTLPERNAQEHNEESYEGRRSLESKEAVGRKLPQPPSEQKKEKNTEPIVFYGEDNEFDLYD